MSSLTQSIPNATPLITDAIDAGLAIGHVYAAVRLVDHGNLWVDKISVAVLPEECQRKIDQHAELCPSWHAANPVVRIARFRMVEMS